VAAELSKSVPAPNGACNLKDKIADSLGRTSLKVRLRLAKQLQQLWRGYM